jgi:hypothetical protein
MPCVRFAMHCTYSTNVLTLYVIYTDGEGQTTKLPVAMRVVSLVSSRFCVEG